MPTPQTLLDLAYLDNLIAPTFDITLKMSNLKNATIVVVGAGYGGLTTAIELRRKGASVRVYESTKALSEQGSAPDAGDFTSCENPK